jgi:hypothetical protein
VNLARRAGDAELLDITDAVLAERHDAQHASMDLETLLRNGSSAYTVNTDGNGLERRVPTTIKQAATHAAKSSPAVQTHLEAAWRAAHRIPPEPETAYTAAVKAIEAAILSIVLPDHPQAALAWPSGRARGHADGGRGQRRGSRDGRPHRSDGRRLARTPGATPSLGLRCLPSLQPGAPKPD